jgi:predicted DNA-binding protein
MRMEAELHWRLKVYAFQRGVSMADCVREALEQWLPAQEKNLKD